MVMSLVVNRNREPRYKDFIVYKKDGIFYISRVVATAGQSVTVMDDILYVNNKVKKEPYISKIKSEYLSTSDTQQPFTSDFSVNTVSNGKYNEVPKGYYLVLNDDRQNTNDSRSFWTNQRKVKIRWCCLLSKVFTHFKSIWIYYKSE